MFILLIFVLEMSFFTNARGWIIRANKSGAPLVIVFKWPNGAQLGHVYSFPVDLD